MVSSCLLHAEDVFLGFKQGLVSFEDSDPQRGEVSGFLVVSLENHQKGYQLQKRGPQQRHVLLERCFCCG